MDALVERRETTPTGEGLRDKTTRVLCQGLLVAIML